MVGNKDIMPKFNDLIGSGSVHVAKKISGGGGGYVHLEKQGGPRVMSPYSK